MKTYNFTQKEEHILEKLDRLFEKEHGGCTDNTCSMSLCFAAGYTMHAIECFKNSGAASTKFNTLIEKLPVEKLRYWANKEAEDFTRETPHVECKNCNAIIWNTPSGENPCCDSCHNYTPIGAL